MLWGGCSSLSLLAGTSVSPADPFVCHPWRAALGLPSAGQGAVLSPPRAPLPVSLPACPPCPCTSLPTAVPSSVGRHDAVLPAQKQKPPEGGRGHPGSSGAAAPCPVLAPGTAPSPPPPASPSHPVSPLYFLCHLRSFGPFSRTPWQETHVPLQSDSFCGFRLQSPLPGDRRHPELEASIWQGVLVAGGAGGGGGPGGGLKGSAELAPRVRASARTLPELGTAPGW